MLLLQYLTESAKWISASLFTQTWNRTFCDTIEFMGLVFNKPINPINRQNVCLSAHSMCINDHETRLSMREPNQSRANSLTHFSKYLSLSKNTFCLHFCNYMGYNGFVVLSCFSFLLFFTGSIFTFYVQDSDFYLMYAYE